MLQNIQRFYRSATSYSSMGFGDDRTIYIESFMSHHWFVTRVTRQPSYRGWVFVLCTRKVRDYDKRNADIPWPWWWP